MLYSSTYTRRQGCQASARRICIHSELSLKIAGDICRNKIERTTQTFGLPF